MRYNVYPPRNSIRPYHAITNFCKKKSPVLYCSVQLTELVFLLAEGRWPT